MKIKLKDILKNEERKIILKTYEACKHNQSMTAIQLGISRTALIYKLKSYKETEDLIELNNELEINPKTLFNQNKSSE